jgi:hypothetical protein
MPTPAPSTPSPLGSLLAAFCDPEKQATCCVCQTRRRDRDVATCSDPECLDRLMRVLAQGRF